MGKRGFSGVIYGKDFWYFCLAVDISSVPSFVFIKMPQVLSGMWVALGGAMASGDYSVAYRWV